MEIMWPYLSAFGFPDFSETLEATGFTAPFLCSRIQIQKIPTIPDSPLLRHVSLLLCPSSRRGLRLAAQLENSTLHAFGSFADEELAGTVEDRFIAVGLDLATFFLLPSVSAPSSPSFWGS